MDATLEATERNNRAAMERVRYERIAEKRQEVVGELYGQLQDLMKQFYDEVRIGEESPQYPRSQTKFASERKWGEVNWYFTRHSLWLDSESSERFGEAMSQILTRIGGINMALYDPDIPEHEAKNILRRADEWYWSGYRELDAILRDSLKKSIGVIEEAPGADLLSDKPASTTTEP